MDAIFAGNNRACVGTLTAFRALGTRRALIGFDDFEAAALVEPAVTVVTHDVAVMGRLAARALLARIGGSREPSVHTVLPTTIISRGSEVPTTPDRPPTRSTSFPSENPTPPRKSAP